MSYEVLYRCELADLLKTESGIVYTDPMGKKTDLLVSIDLFQIGVSVTRAYGFPPDAPYTEQQAHDLLLKKLTDIQASSANVSPADGWPKQDLARPRLYLGARGYDGNRIRNTRRLGSRGYDLMADSDGRKRHVHLLNVFHIL